MPARSLGSPMTASDDELRRMVEEAARAARAAQEAAERVAREQPPWWQEALRSITILLTTLLDGVVGRLRAEIEGARRAGEELVARVLLALSRSAQHLARAVAMMLVTGILLATAIVILAVGLVSTLNHLVGDPWGTLLAGAFFLVLALVTGLVARARLRAIGDEARLLAPRVR
jgi:hypothetical protein